MNAATEQACGAEATPSIKRSRKVLRTVSHHAGLSFWTVASSPSGRKMSSCCFDVPAEPYGEGYKTGVRKAGELMAAMQAQLCDGMQAMHVLQEVYRVRAENYSSAPSRQGAAAGLLATVGQLLQGAATHLDHARLCVDIEQGQLDAEQRHADRKAARSAQFVERMAALRRKEARQ